MITSLDLPSQLQNLTQYYSQGVKNSKEKKVNKYIHKLKLSILEFCLRPQNSIRSSASFLSQNGLICIQNPDFQHEQILGEVPASFLSYAHKVGNVSYDLKHKYVSMEMELIQTQKVPLDYVKELYQNFNVDSTSRERALDVVQTFEQKLFHSYNNECPSLREKNWIDFYFGKEELPAQLLKITSVKDKPQFEFYFNEHYMNLVGVRPQILTSVILQSQQIPEIDTTSDLYRWNDITEGFLSCHETPAIKEHNALVVLYEGYKVNVLIRDEFTHTYDQDTDCHIYVRKLTYKVTNPIAHQYIFDKNRLCRNLMKHKQDNNIFERNTSTFEEFKMMTDVKKPKKNNCGFKIIEKD